MGVKSRRKAREAALRALYQLEIGKLPFGAVLGELKEQSELSEDLLEFALQLLNGVRDNLNELDEQLKNRITEYDYSRVAAIDRNVLRIAAYELIHIPEMPPAITINEAIEISKKYSTAESGKFVNGVLGNLLKDLPKAQWDPATVPEEEPCEEIEAEPEVETIEAGSEEAEKLSKMGVWKIRKEEQA